MTTLTNTPPSSAESRSPIVLLARHFPPGNFGRYLLVGALNTLFGYGAYALLTALLQPLMPHGYMLAAVVAHFISITFSFTTYKAFVFKTKGNYLKEWARSIVVYSGGFVVTLILLPILVFSVRHLTSLTTAAPYVAGAIMMVLNAVYYFIAHGMFTFRPNEVRKSET